MSASNPLPNSQERLYRALLADIEKAAALLGRPQLPPSTIQEIRDLPKCIRTMEGQIQDHKYWQIIHTRADELDRALDKFSN
jgi:hypothetical protein